MNCCKVSGCGLPLHGRDWCQGHYDASRTVHALGWASCARCRVAYVSGAWAGHARKPCGCSQRRGRAFRSCEACGRLYVPSACDVLTCSRRCGQRLRLVGQASVVGWASCAGCRNPFRVDGRRRKCSGGCFPTGRRVSELPRRCLECGVGFVGHGRAKFCCKRCSGRAHRRERRHLERSSGVRRDAKRRVPLITILLVGERDGWRCHLCRGRVARSEASLDHLVPLVDGGAHVASNVALAHHDCNSLRSNRGAAQLLLIG